MAGLIHVRADVLERMLEEARRVADQECCGLLAGRDGVITAIFPAWNALASASAYEIAPEELFRLHREMRAAGLDHMGIYHSHPAGPAFPSARDVERAYYPEAAYFIISFSPDALEGRRAGIHAYSIHDGRVTQLEMVRV